MNGSNIAQGDNIRRQLGAGLMMLAQLKTAQIVRQYTMVVWSGYKGVIHGYLFKPIDCHI